MDTQTLQKSNIIFIIVLKLVQIVLQIALTITLWEAASHSLVYMFCLLVSLLFTLGIIFAFVLEVQIYKKFLFENILWFMILMAYLIVILALSIHFHSFKSKNVTTLVTTSPFSREIAEDFKQSRLQEETFNFVAVYKKAAIFMILIIVIQFIIFAAVNGVPLLWFIFKTFQSEDEFPLLPYYPQVGPFPDEPMTLPNLTQRLNLNSQIETFTTLETQSGAGGGSVSIEGINPSKKATAECKSPQKTDFSDLIVLFSKLYKLPHKDVEESQ